MKERPDAKGKGVRKRPARAGVTRLSTADAAPLAACAVAPVMLSPTRPLPRTCPVVGVGASAGGLEALEAFFAGVPENSGMAFVVVQHLSPHHRGFLPDLLQRATTMKVQEAQDKTPVQPNRVYVIPPNTDMSILHHRLHLFVRAPSHGPHLPIDFFFQSLAEDLGELAAGVVLSGMGADGTVGLRSIRQRGGLVVVQDPSTARFDAMPRSAINAGLADLVGPAGELPSRVASHLHRGSPDNAADAQQAEEHRNLLEQITVLVRAKTGHDFSLYKKSTLWRRIDGRMRLRGITDLADYVGVLQSQPTELETLFTALLIGCTSFFRDPAMWNTLAAKALPDLLAARSGAAVIRAWSAGCSTGEEAYSLAILFSEAMDSLEPAARPALQLFATDLDRDAIDRARIGLFPPDIATTVSEARLRRFFVKEDQGYRVSRAIREMITFATHNVITDPPFTHVDLVMCRNLLIYVRPVLQKRLLSMFHYVLHPGGLLCLGGAESASDADDMFVPIAEEVRLYHPVGGRVRPDPIGLPPLTPPGLFGSKARAAWRPPPSVHQLADELLLRHFSPPAVLVNDQGDIVHISGRTGRYLEPATGKANWSLFSMAREGLIQPLSSAFRRALRTSERVVVRDVRVRTNQGIQAVDLIVQSIEDPVPLRGMVLVVFEEAKPSTLAEQARAAPLGRKSALVADLERELQNVSQELQASREELQTWREEVTTSNEELQSANEELQSVNEELTNSTEELQSLNEELRTVNAEQGAKMAELTVANSDLHNLLHTLPLAVLFVDSTLRVRRFTTGVSSVFKLIPSDVGRPLSDIACEVAYPELLDDAKEVLASLMPREERCRGQDGCWYAIRIAPYRAGDNRVDGVVLTFTDVTKLAALEAELEGGKAQ